MALYFMSYDLRDDKDYDKLYSKLDDFDAVRIVESTWCFKRYNTSTQDLRDFFKRFIDEDDGIIISKVPSWHSWNVDNSPNDLT